jgi:putative oxidoreductase
MLEIPRPFERLLLLTGRGLLGLYFIVPGISKITGFAQTSDYMAAHGVPLIPVLLVLTIAIQIGGGLALMSGFRAQLIAFVLAGLTLVISVFMHNFWVMPEGLERNHELQNFIKNLAIMAGLLYVAGARLHSRTEKSSVT